MNGLKAAIRLNIQDTMELWRDTRRKSNDFGFTP
jgi:hypothetical protein